MSCSTEQDWCFSHTLSSRQVPFPTSLTQQIGSSFVLAVWSQTKFILEGRAYPSLRKGIYQCHCKGHACCSGRWPMKWLCTPHLSFTLLPCKATHSKCQPNSSWGLVTRHHGHHCFYLETTGEHHPKEMGRLSTCVHLGPIKQTEVEKRGRREGRVQEPW